MARLVLIVGLPGAGKTTVARRLAAERPALRLTPDEWMIPLFETSDVDGKRAVLEGRLISMAFEVLRLGTDVVLDFGFWSRAERAALRSLAAEVGASCDVVYLPIDRDAQLERIAQRWTSSPGETYPMTESDVDLWRSQFEPPDAAELAGDPPPDPPSGWSSWARWATERWPSLVPPPFTDGARATRTR